MATVIDPRDEVFLDASYAIALSAPADRHHNQALRLADELMAARATVVTTHAVLLEIGNSLARQRYRQEAVGLLQLLVTDPAVEIVPLSEDLYARAFDLYRLRPDKEWGMTDCSSFVLMTERGITKALTADIHFQQCGFRALLRETGG